VHSEARGITEINGSCGQEIALADSKVKCKASWFNV